jgi:hypothetical protein
VLFAAALDEIEDFALFERRLADSNKNVLDDL